MTTAVTADNIVGWDRLGWIVESEDGALRFRLTLCCEAPPRGVYRRVGSWGDQPVVECSACGLGLDDAALDPVPQPIGAPCTCIDLGGSWPASLMPGRSTCGQHGDHVPTGP